MSQQKTIQDLKKIVLAVKKYRQLCRKYKLQEAKPFKKNFEGYLQFALNAKEGIKNIKSGKLLISDIENDMDCVESAFLHGVQDWCNRIRHAIDSFEKNIAGAASGNGALKVGFFIFRQGIGRLAGQYKIISHIGIKLFEQITTSLNQKQDKEAQLSIQDIAEVWDSKISAYQKNVDEHRNLYKKFRAERKGVSEEDLLDEIAYWAKGSVKGLPTEEDIKRSMTEIWIKSTTDSNDPFEYLKGNLAGYIMVYVSYSKKLEKETGIGWKPGFVEWGNDYKPFFDDIPSDQAKTTLKMVQKLWPNTPLNKLPYSQQVEIWAYDEGGYKMGHCTLVKENNSWSIGNSNLNSKELQQEILSKYPACILSKLITTNDLTIDD